MITCYLDSQDYSTLTDPKRDTADHRKIKDALLHLARSKQVRFAFSSIAVCESVALTADAAHLAELKAGLLSELCGLNALVSFDRLVCAEVNSLASRSAPPRDMFDSRGRWFPEISIDETSVQHWERMRKIAEDEMKSMGLGRQERRAKARALIKHGMPRQRLISQFDQQGPSVLAAELLKKYPMRPEYVEVMARYVLGQATTNEVNEALMNSLTDPRWMMKWFTTQHALSSPISEMVRKPGRELSQAMRSLAEICVRWAQTLRDTGIDTDPTGKRGDITLRWNGMVDQCLISFVQRSAGEFGIELSKLETTAINTSCPGISAGFRSMCSSVWANIGEGRKEGVSDSQSVDALHAFYAPYVNVFRADRFMAPHIQKQVKNSGTIVVSRLTQLVENLEKQLG